MVDYFFFTKFVRTQGSDWCASNMTCQIKTRLNGTSQDMWTANDEVICNMDSAFMTKYQLAGENRRDTLLRVYNSIFSGFNNTPITSANVLCSSPTPKNETAFLRDRTKEVVENFRFVSFSGFQNGYPNIKKTGYPATFFKRKRIINPIYLNDLSQNITPFYVPQRGRKADGPRRAFSI